MLNFHENRQQFKTIRTGIPIWPFLGVLMAVVALSLVMSGCAACANEPISPERLANAIYKAEGGSRTKHPYGILAKYKHTTPRQACINTIKSALRRYKKSGSGDFIAYLGGTYCPVGAFNDPIGLNRNWVKNVRHYYERGA